MMLFCNLFMEQLSYIAISGRYYIVLSADIFPVTHSVRYTQCTIYNSFW